MNFSKYLLLGVMVISTNFALAAAGKNDPRNVTPEPVLTPGARLVVGDAPDEDFTILRSGEKPETKAAPPLPQKTTIAVVQQPQIQVKQMKPSLPIEKTHKHLFTTNTVATQAATPKPAIATPAAAPSPQAPAKSASHNVKKPAAAPVKVAAQKAKAKVVAVKPVSKNVKKVAASASSKKVKTSVKVAATKKAKAPAKVAASSHPVKKKIAVKKSVSKIKLARTE